MHWSGNRLTQRVKGYEEELGYIEPEPGSNRCVLWVKDTFGVVTTAGAYIRADEYSSLAVAKSKALPLNWHLIWMRGVLKRKSEPPSGPRFPRWPKLPKVTEWLSWVSLLWNNRDTIIEAAKGILDALPGLFRRRAASSGVP